MAGNRNRESRLSFETRVSAEFKSSLKLSKSQQAFIALDLDDTTFVGCIEKHYRAYALLARERGLDLTKLPLLEDVLQSSRASLHFTHLFPDAFEIECRLREAPFVHRLAPMHPQMKEIFRDLDGAQLLPSVSLTARPGSLKRLSEKEVVKATGYEFPVIALPQGVTPHEAEQWKIETLLDFEHELRGRKPVVMIDNSPGLFEKLTELNHPNIIPLLYKSNPQLDRNEADWDTLQCVLDSILLRWTATVR